MAYNRGLDVLNEIFKKNKKDIVLKIKKRNIYVVVVAHGVTSKAPVVHVVLQKWKKMRKHM